MRRKRDRRVSEVGREDEPGVSGEAERLAAGLVEPPECAESKGRVLAAQPERGTVQGKERGGVTELGLDAVAAPVSRLGEPRWRGRSTTARSGKKELNYPERGVVLRPVPGRTGPVAVAEHWRQPR